MTGYSGRRLVDKLNIKPGFRVAIVNEPPGYRNLLKPLPAGIEIQGRLAGQVDFIHYFCTQLDDLRKDFPKLAKCVIKIGMVWVSWPKGGSKIPTDLNENIVREVGINNGMVDVKVCAIDENWSGLKFVYRLVDR
jgi:hypothetical protein